MLGLQEHVTVPGFKQCWGSNLGLPAGMLGNHPINWAFPRPLHPVRKPAFVNIATLSILITSVQCSLFLTSQSSKLLLTKQPARYVYIPPNRINRHTLLQSHYCPRYASCPNSLAFDFKSAWGVQPQVACKSIYTDEATSCAHLLLSTPPSCAQPLLCLLGKEILLPDCGFLQSCKQ